MKKLFRIFCISLIASSPSQLLAQQVYSLDRCVEMALESNKDIQAAKHKQQKYEYEKKALYANYFPNISLSAAAKSSRGLPTCSALHHLGFLTDIRKQYRTIFPGH